MKKIAFILSIMVILTACKSETSEEKNTEASTETETVQAAEAEKSYKGEFIYIDDGAVLKGSNFIYGVAINEKAEELKNRVAPIKKETYDMVPVIVKGTVSKNNAGGDGWEEIITISEIVYVSDSPAEADIKIEDKKE